MAVALACLRRLQAGVWQAARPILSPYFSLFQLRFRRLFAHCYTCSNVKTANLTRLGRRVHTASSPVPTRSPTAFDVDSGVPFPEAEQTHDAGGLQSVVGSKRQRPGSRASLPPKGHRARICFSPISPDFASRKKKGCTTSTAGAAVAAGYTLGRGVNSAAVVAAAAPGL
jgi:hypothetical protein